MTCKLNKYLVLPSFICTIKWCLVHSAKGQSCRDPNLVGRWWWVETSIYFFWALKLHTRVCFNHRFASTEKAELAEQLVDVVSLPPASNGAVAATNGIQNENTISVLLNFEVEEVRNLPELRV